MIRDWQKTGAYRWREDPCVGERGRQRCVQGHRAEPPDREERGGEACAEGDPWMSCWGAEAAGPFTAALRESLCRLSWAGQSQSVHSSSTRVSLSAELSRSEPTRSQQLYESLCRLSRAGQSQPVHSSSTRVSLSAELSRSEPDMGQLTWKVNQLN